MNEHSTASEHAVPDLANLLREHPPFDRMTAADLDWLLAHAVLAYYARGEPVPSGADAPPERLNLVYSGWLTAQLGDLEQEVLPGDMIPLQALLEQEPSRVRCWAGTDSFVLELDRATVDALRERSAAFDDYCRHGISNLRSRSVRATRAAAMEQLSSGPKPLDNPLGQLIRRAPVTCTRNTSVREAVRLMHAAGVDSVAIIDAGERPLGIFTLHDLRRLLTAGERDLDRPMGPLMTADPHSLQRTAQVFDAQLLMARHGIRHACLLDGERLVGVLSERDLFDTQRAGLVRLARQIRAATSVQALAECRARFHRLVDVMLTQAASAAQIHQLLSALDDHIVARVVELCEREAGYGLPGFSWLAFGSEARQEQALYAEQCNGMLFADEAGAAESVRSRLLPLAGRVNQALAECGFALSSRQVMAGNSAFCMSQSEWVQYFHGLLEAPQRLAEQAGQFDLRPLAGAHQSACQLHATVVDQAAASPGFLYQLAEAAPGRRPTSGVFRELTAGSRLNIRADVIDPLVDSVRVLALGRGVRANSTRQRLAALVEAGSLSATQAHTWDQALDFLQLLRVRHHQRQAQASRPLGDELDIRQLDVVDRRLLKNACEEAQAVPSVLKQQVGSR